LFLWDYWGKAAFINLKGDLLIVNAVAFREKVDFND
jgi:hypothetical protein